MRIDALNATASGQPAARPARSAAAQAPLPAAAYPAPEQAQVREAVSAANEALKAASSTVQFSVEQESGRTVIQVVDESTREVIRQIPSEEMIAIRRELERLQGVLMRSKA